jgi:16S rRNA (uracil1498-N3)-methyltransferase
MPRFYCPAPLATDEVLDLPAGAARHVQVLRLQPGDSITLFNGMGCGMADAPHAGGEFEATVLRMGRNDVAVQIGLYSAVEREAARAVHLVVGMPANERMDWLVEKATELGVASIQPLMTERSVLRLSHERAEKKQAHWQSIAIAACEQCGRNQVPVVRAVMAFSQWAKILNDGPGKSPPTRVNYLLSLRGDSQPLRQAMALSRSQGSAEDEVTFLSGPEGGLSEGEEQAALAAGFTAVSLGPRVLRAETAALAALTLLA